MLDIFVASQVTATTAVAEELDLITRLKDIAAQVKLIITMLLQCYSEDDEEQYLHQSHLQEMVTHFICQTRLRLSRVYTVLPCSYCIN